MDLSKLSDVQRRAVTTTEGPVLVLAGAGSGKTSVLTNRVAYLIQEKGVSPYSILAITFTNKAANEMRERIAQLVQEDVSRMAISTFHSMCARFLRVNAEKLGYAPAFTIYDAAEITTLMKKVLADLRIDNKFMDARFCQSAISACKNAAADEAARKKYLARRWPNAEEELLDVYALYQKRLLAENAMDFDDLLCNMLRLLREHDDVRDYYASRFRYVLVDEYQDTNGVQYELVRLLSEKYQNIFVVGDDDQSIYAWRGADIRNILDFEKDYPGAYVIKLEQNFRSHAKILDAANAVISQADERKEKRLWSARTDGECPRLFTASNEYAEAEFVAREISRLNREGRAYQDIAVLYRTHAQSRALEEKLRTYGIPYRVYGGMSFYERKEVKDLIAYLTILANPRADTALLRIVNTPRRGIGDVSIEKLRICAEENGLSLLEAAARADEFLPSPAANKLAQFCACYEEMLHGIEGKSIGEAIYEVFVRSGYREMLLLQEGTEAETRMENVEELINSAYAFEKASEEQPTLDEFLASLSLISEMDTTAESGSVTLMTLHSAKGLEFDTVFMVGMEETVFPSWRSINENKIDEERRLCYVGITRAKNHLYFTNCNSRNLYAGASANKPSRFLQDIPPALIEQLTPAAPTRRPAHAAARTVAPPAHPKAVFQPQVKTDASAFRVGMTVEHGKFGRGSIRSIVDVGGKTMAVIAFADGERKMFLEFAPLKIV